RRSPCSIAFALGLITQVPSVAQAQEAEAITPAQMQAEARDYYDGEITASLLFAAYGGVTAGTGAIALTRTGDFAKGYGFSPLIAGGATLVGAVGYAIAVKFRGAYYTGLANTDLARFKREESEHIGGTGNRFWLYLGTELLIAAAGLGAAIYGMAAKN